MDDELSPRARLLVDAAMEEDVPAPAVADGSWEMVVSRLTLEAASAAEATPGARESPAPRHGWVVFVVLALVIAVAGGLLWLVLQPRPKPPTTVVPTATVPSPSSPLPTKAAPSETAPPPAAASEPSIDPAKLLDEAESAEPTRALELLARHAELAPVGPDLDRRMALRVLALCSLGRTQDARAEARAFLREPRDPAWTKRVRTSCGSSF